MKGKFCLFLMCVGVVAAAFAEIVDIDWKYDTSARTQSVPAPTEAQSSATEVDTVSRTTGEGSAVLADGCFWMLSPEATAEDVIILYAPGALLFFR